MNASKWAVSPVEPTTEAPNAYPPDTSAYPGDEFSQTGPGDDLFDDDFTPIAEPMVETAPPRQPRTFTPRGRGRGRGRSGGRAGMPAARAPTTPSLAQPVNAPAATAPAPASSATHDIASTAQGGDLASDAPSTVEAVSTQSEPSVASNAAGNTANTATQAVRGDRSGTGGVKKAKLTEEELSARMEAIKLKNASLEAAHARAEADQASFQAREAEAQTRRRVERQNRQQMMGERERNRLRKLGALQGREWDADKDADERLSDGRKGQAQSRRGMYGGISGGHTSTNEHDQADEGFLDQRHDDRASGRGRGGRGSGGRGDAGQSRGRGRGGRGGRGRDAGGGESGPKHAPSASSQNDFPALQTPVSSSAQGGSSDAVKSPLSLVDNPGSAPTLKTVLPQLKKSWADEMETPITPSNKA